MAELEGTHSWRVIKSEKEAEILEGGKLLTLRAGLLENLPNLEPIHKGKEWPVKLRVVVSKPRANTVLVRQYEIDHFYKMIKIQTNGDIWSDHMLLQPIPHQFALACNQGTIMEFNFEKKNKKWKEAQNSHFLPETFNISPTTTEFWAKEEIIVQNSLLCCQAAYDKNPETYMSSIEKRFTSGKYECISLEGKPQKCVLAFCDESSTMYIAFKGSGLEKREDLDDWLVNLTLKLHDFKLKEDPGFSPKVHTGFYQRAKKWIDDEQIMKKIKEWNPKRIITTGHSLGAAISSMVHILLVLWQDQAMKNVELQNIAFASPLFGNLDLKRAILKHPDLRLRNMYHFVNCDDIIPAVTIIEETYDSLTWGGKNIADSSKLLLNLIYHLAKALKIEMDENKKRQFEDELENVLEELKKRRRMIDEPLHENRGTDTYMPIGHFIFMKKKDTGQSDLHVFDLKESIEDSEHQWVCQILVKPLEILGDVYVINNPIKQAKKIMSAHGLDNYFAQVANCLSSGDHDTLTQWKKATDNKNSQEIQSPPQKTRRLGKNSVEKINYPPQNNRRL